MSSDFNNITPNKMFNFNLNSLKSTPKCSPLIPSRENNNPKLKLFNLSKSNLFSNGKNNFNRNYIDYINNTDNFLIPFSRSFIPKSIVNQKTNDLTQKKLQISNKKQLFSEMQTISNKLNNNDSFSEIKPQKSFLNKKRKHMTSEEIELEKMKKEKEALKLLMNKNKKLYLKSFKYSPMKITPSPLTTFIPFKLSSNNNSKFIKQGKSNTIYEVNKQNQKIRLKMQQKIEKLTNNTVKDTILLNNVDYLKKQNELYNELFNKENFTNSFTNSKKEKKILINKQRSITPIKDFNSFKSENLKSFDSQIKKNKVNNTIIDYLKNFRKTKT